MEKVDYAGLGRRIRYFRKRRGLTQEELANLVELTQKHISNIECAHSIPTLQTFVKISNCCWAILWPFLTPAGRRRWPP